jgi:hypothetical protein
MSNIARKDTLIKLYDYIIQESHIAKNVANRGNYRRASETLDKAIGEVKRQLVVAEDEAALPETVDAEVTDEEIRLWEARVEHLNSVMENMSTFYNDQNAKIQVKKELPEARKKAQKAQAKLVQEQTFEEKLADLESLAEERKRPLEVREKLNQLNAQFRVLHRNNDVPVDTLNQAMEVTYQRLINGNSPHSRTNFENFTNKLHKADSLPLKLLAAAMISLGAALIAAAIFFAPAVILAPSAGLPTVWGTVAGVSTLTAGLCAAGGFFAGKQTKRMELADMMNEFGDEEHIDQVYR